MKILFINGSPNKNGNTAALAAALLRGREYTIKRFAGLYGMDYCGMASNQREAAELGKKI